MKTCGKCNAQKSVSEFHRAAKRKDGLQSYCKDCIRETRTQWARDNKEKVADSRMWSRYRMRPEDFITMLESQSGQCALCPEVISRENADIDHDHQTGRVRSLLCHSCNTEVGRYESIRVDLIAKYVNSFKLV